MRVTVVLPTYNEALNLPAVAEEILSQPIEGLGILVVDDGSPDGTGEIAERLRGEYPGRIQVLHRSGKLGLGSAYLAGFSHALQNGAELVLEMDADGSHPPALLPILVEAAESADLVIGSRYAPGGGVEPRWSWTRKQLSRWGNNYARLVTGLPVRDATAGFKCFRGDALKRIDLSRIRSDGYSFQVELTYACYRKHLRIREVPFTFLERARGRSKMSLAIVLEAVWRVWQVKWRY